MDTHNLANAAATLASDKMDTARHIGCDAVDKGYESARDYISKGLNYAGEVSDGLTDLVQRQPWLALAGAFVIGYLAAKTLRQISL